MSCELNPGLLSFHDPVPLVVSGLICVHLRNPQPGTGNPHCPLPTLPPHSEALRLGRSTPPSVPDTTPTAPQSRPAARRPALPSSTSATVPQKSLAWAACSPVRRCHRQSAARSRRSESRSARPPERIAAEYSGLARPTPSAHRSRACAPELLPA